MMKRRVPFYRIGPLQVDLEPYIAPYLLTGLCDENEEIALEVFWLIERIGEAYEAEHEEDLRKTKQYGAWGAPIGPLGAFKISLRCLICITNNYT